MSHLVEQIVKYLNSTGKIMWFQDTMRLKRNIFLKPAALFDMFFVLFRANFAENFIDSHTAALRDKLLNNSEINDVAINKMTADLLQKGQLSIDLLKLLWFPILIVNSVEILYEIATMFMFYFNLGYPHLSKEKLKQIFEPCIERDRNDLNKIHSHDSVTHEYPKTILPFDSIIVPFYLPNIKDKSEISRIKQTLASECRNNSDKAVKLKLRKEKARLCPHIAHKYTFPWGLSSGIFEKFSTSCIINSSLYYKVHYKNFIHAANEENDIE